MPSDGRSFFAAFMLLLRVGAAVKEKVLPPQTGKQWTLDHRVLVVVVPLISLPVLPIDGRSFFAAFMLVVYTCTTAKKKVLPPQGGKR